MSRTNDVNIAMQYAKSGVDGVHLMDSHKATIGWVVNTLAAEVERLEAEHIEAMAAITAVSRAAGQERTRAETAEARVAELEAQLNKGIDAYMNEPHCCSGRECGCMGVTRFEQIVGEELGQRMATMREKNARLRAALESLQSDAQCTIDLYNKIGPTWTSRDSGAEYYDASYVIGSAEERIATIKAALADTKGTT